jgi:hypothetical protein
MGAKWSYKRVDTVVDVSGEAANSIIWKPEDMLELPELAYKECRGTGTIVFNSKSMNSIWGQRGSIQHGK